MVAATPDVNVVAILFTDQLSLSRTTRVTATSVVALSFCGARESAVPLERKFNLASAFAPFLLTRTSDSERARGEVVCAFTPSTKTRAAPVPMANTKLRMAKSGNGDPARVWLSECFTIKIRLLHVTITTESNVDPTVAPITNETAIAEQDSYE